jgi:hypothetical protein
MAELRFLRRHSGHDAVRFWRRFGFQCRWHEAQTSFIEQKCKPLGRRINSE